MTPPTSQGRLWPLEKADLKKNIISGFVIFLVALPLSIGISVASGAPPTAGVLAAIVGGIIGSLISGSYVTISGPAAGLIVVILDSVVGLGTGDVIRGFKLTLGAIVVAGLIQIAMGSLRLGTVALTVPINALHGMLASIGLTIMIKQIFVLEGINPKQKSVFFQIFELPERWADNNGEILLIGLCCLATMILFNKFPKINKVFPAALAAVTLGYIFSYIVDIERPHEVILFHQHYEVGPKYLLHIPENLKDYIITPLFDFARPEFYLSILTIALVASIESLLSTYAIDKLDPLKRVSDLNMDLISKGVCNTLLGLIGGLPVISEIVRSSANVSNGATTRWSNLMHGFFILIFAASFPFLLNKIPLTAFAAVLIFVGYKLANPKQLKTVYKCGKEQLAVFLVTLLVTLNTDLLIGILCGVLLEFSINAIKSKTLVALFKLTIKMQREGEIEILTISGPVVFTNMLSLKSKIEKSTATHIDVRISETAHVDYSSRTLMATIKEQMALKQKMINFQGLSLPCHEPH